MVVITGPDPVIHASFGADPSTGRHVEGRIRSGHDEW
jgi:hypothetical protein